MDVNNNIFYFGVIIPGLDHRFGSPNRTGNVIDIIQLCACLKRAKIRKIYSPEFGDKKYANIFR